MRTQLSILIELQHAESEIGKLQQKKRDLPAEIERLDAAFREFQHHAEVTKKKYEDLLQSHREREEKLKRGQESLKKAKERLSEVKTNKEYQAVLKEIEIIEDRNSNLEDEIISLLDILDGIQEEWAAREKEMDAYSRSYEAKRLKLEEEFQALHRALDDCNEKSVHLRKEVADDLRKQYEAIKTLNRGLAVVPAWKEICGGCHMNIPPQLYIELQKSLDLCICPNCNRIMYWHERNGVQP